MKVNRGYLLNSSVGEYRVVDFLGAGGMGEVYRAVHAKIGRAVAVKVLTQAALTDGMSERFFNEARIQASLQHPNIATLFDFIELDGQPCIIMEYIDGQTLTDRIRPYGQPLPLPEAIEIFRTVVEAIAHIHGHGIVHRDIKSNNIKISASGQVKLLDFGIAKAQASPGLTETGSVVGTLEYISPEQLRLGVADARSDIWALGVLLYEMATGRMPFEATTLGELCEKIIKVSYAPPSNFNPLLPPDMALIISRCLKKSPGDRYQSAQQLLQDVTRLTTLISSPHLERVLTRKPAERGTAAIVWARKNWQILSITAAVAMIMIVSILSIYWAASSGATEVSKQGSTQSPDSPSSPSLQSGSAAAQVRNIEIAVSEGEAEVYDLAGQLLGKTSSKDPFIYQAKSGDNINLILKREGYSEESVNITVTPNRDRYTYTMRQ